MQLNRRKNKNKYQQNMMQLQGKGKEEKLQTQMRTKQKKMSGKRREETHRNFMDLKDDQEVKQTSSIKLIVSSGKCKNAVRKSEEVL